ncbi:site-specific integrase [Nonomuraea sp. H19]|uniref:site-specific integrase n=1 Tax=Nonomuraea sp. H19 TaxID=3452206 RepID=UPI003F8CBBA4
MWADPQQRQLIERVGGRAHGQRQAGGAGRRTVAMGEQGRIALLSGVSVVAFPGQPDPAPHATRTTITVAVERFLGSRTAATTCTRYAETLARLTAITGPDHPVAALTLEQCAAVMDRWNTAAAATWNRHLSALVSFTTWAQRQELLATNPGRRLERRKPARRGDRAIPATRLEKLFTDPAHALRESTRPAPRRMSRTRSAS